MTEVDNTSIPQYGLISQIHESNKPVRQKHAEKVGIAVSLAVGLAAVAGIAIGVAQDHMNGAFLSLVGGMGAMAGAYFAARGLINLSDKKRDEKLDEKLVKDPNYQQRPSEAEWAAIGDLLDPTTLNELNM